MCESSNDEFILTPVELAESANNAQMSFLPQKSRKKYYTQQEEVPVFESLMSTYNILSGLMGIGVMYPNPKTDKWRLIAIAFVTIVSAPFILITTFDVLRFFSENDLANVIRISTVSGPYSLVIVKMSLLYWKRRQAEMIIQEIERDYAIAKTAPTKIRKIIYKNVQKNKFFEKLWTALVFTAVFMFPLSATIMNVHSNLTSGDNRYMITDLRVPFVDDPEERFTSPYFEIMFGYTFYICCYYFIYFTCYEIFILISIGHASLKFELFHAALEDAMLVSDEGKRKNMVSGVIREQIRALWYVDLLKDSFNIWLGVVTLGTLGQLCCCMFYILEGYGFDERYSIFTIVVILYIYVICYRAHELKDIAEETPSKIFLCGWHNKRDLGLWKTLTFMIARSQKVVEIRALYFLVFDMDFFVFIVKSAYSMFTLLKK